MPITPASWVMSHVGIPPPAPPSLKGPLSQKIPSKNLLSVWPAAKVTPKRLSEGLPLQFALSRYQPLRLANFLALHHKSKCCLSNVIYLETGPKAGCKVQLRKLRNFRTELVSFPILQCIGYICKASATNDKVFVAGTAPSQLHNPNFLEIVSKDAVRCCPNKNLFPSFHTMLNCLLLPSPPFSAAPAELSDPSFLLFTPSLQ